MENPFCYLTSSINISFSNGVEKDHIIEVALDDRANSELCDPDKILHFIKDGKRIT